MTYGISQVAVYVADQQRALEFWTGKMGFSVATDVPYTEDERWIEVVPPGGGTRLVLSKRGQGWPEWPEPMGYVLFGADDIVKTYEDLRARGVEFTQAPTREPWGWSAVFTDQDGNAFHLGQSGD